jgi:putative thiamine transport system permease protein
MGATLRRLTNPGGLVAIVLAASVAPSLLWVVYASAASAFDRAAWAALFAHPQLWTSLLLSLFTAVVATLASVFLTAFILSRVFGSQAWSRWVNQLGFMLAVPHVALSVAVVLLIAPSGWLLRAFSPWATGFELPPAWQTTQDSMGIGLVVCLILKETPFLLWTAATQLQRADVGPRLRRELLTAQSMGYSAARAWWQVAWPQLWPRLLAPIIAVFAYALTVVDMALVIGPQRPPTLGATAWRWLNDGDPNVAAQGAVAAWALAGALMLCSMLFWAYSQLRNRFPRSVLGRRSGFLERLLPAAASQTPVLPNALAKIYLLLLIVLFATSFFGAWPFPHLLPVHWGLAAWDVVLRGSSTLAWTVLLAIVCALLCVAWSMLWLEFAPRRWQQWSQRVSYVPLVLPGTLWVIGVYRLTIGLQLDGHWLGVLWAHTLAALPYALITLAPAYLAFDPRASQVVATLGHSRMSFLLRVKWPLLKASLWAALAVAFSVSIAQYLTTLFVGAGRHPTITTEAVALASGGARNIAAAFALAQWVLVAAAFLLAAWLGRPRWPLAGSGK